MRQEMHQRRFHHSRGVQAQRAGEEGEGDDQELRGRQRWWEHRRLRRIRLRLWNAWRAGQQRARHVRLRPTGSYNSELQLHPPALPRRLRLRIRWNIQIFRSIYTCFMLRLGFRFWLGFWFSFWFRLWFRLRCRFASLACVLCCVVCFLLCASSPARMGSDQMVTLVIIEIMPGLFEESGLYNVHW